MVVEKDRILEPLRELETAVSEKLSMPGLTLSQRNILDDLQALLMDLDSTVVLNELNQCIDGLNEKSENLKKINTRIKQKIENLEDISAKVKKIADILEAITKAFGLLIGVGLLSESVP